MSTNKRTAHAHSSPNGNKKVRSDDVKDASNCPPSYDDVHYQTRSGGRDNPLWQVAKGVLQDGRFVSQKGTEEVSRFPKHKVFREAIEQWMRQNIKDKDDGTYPSCTMDNGRVLLHDACRQCYPNKTADQIYICVKNAVKKAVGVVRQKVAGGGEVGERVDLAEKRGNDNFHKLNPTYNSDYYEERDTGNARRRQYDIDNREHKYDVRKRRLQQEREDKLAAHSSFLEGYAADHSSIDISSANGQLVSELMDTELPSLQCRDLLRCLRPLQHWSTIPLHGMEVHDLSNWNHLADYNGKCLYPFGKEGDEKSIKGVWTSPTHVAGGVDFILRHKMETVYQLAVNNQDGIVKLYGYIFGCLHPDYARFSTFSNGRLTYCKSFALSREPARVGPDVADFALLEVTLKTTVDSTKHKVLHYELVGAPKVLVNNIKSLHLMNPTNPTVVASLMRRYPSPKKRREGGKENNLESEDSELESEDSELESEDSELESEESEEDEPLYDSYIKADPQKMLVDFSLVNNNMDAKRKAKRPYQS